MASIVDYLKSKGQPSDFASRARMAEEQGITGYTGTAGQNIALLNKVQTALPTPAPVTNPAVPPVRTTPTGPIQQRDYSREQATQKTIGRVPYPWEQDQFLRMTYTPEELRALGLDKGFQDLSVQAGNARADLLATPKPTNTGLGVLEEALKAKSGVGNQPLGTSDLFARAGVSGYAVLAKSLAERSNEMKNSYDNYANLVTKVSGGMKDTYNTALDKYNLLKGEYDTQVSRMTKLQDDIVQHEEALDLLKQKAELDLKAKEFEAKLKGGGGGGGGGITLTPDQKRKAFALGYTAEEIASPTPDLVQAVYQGTRTVPGVHLTGLADTLSKIFLGGSPSTPNTTRSLATPKASSTSFEDL